MDRHDPARAVRRARALRAAAFAAGLAVAASVIVLSVPPGGASTLGASVRMTVAPTGELDVIPAGRVLAIQDMRPGQQGTSGTFTVRNQSPSAVMLRLRGIADREDLDSALSVTVKVDGRRWFSGTLGRLARGTAPLRLASAAQRVVQVQVFVAAGAKHFQGRQTSVALTLATRGARR